MPFEGLKRQWSEISLEKKLAMFVAPVFVAVASGILVPVLTGAFGSDGGPQPPAPPSTSTIEAGGLEVLDLEVSSGEVAENPGDPVEPPMIDLTVRNTGEDISVITGATLRVREVAWIENCEGGAGLDPSVEYDVILPASPDVGETVEADVSQQVPPNSADRFILRLYTPEENLGDGTRLYQLDVGLLHDATAPPLEAGTVLVAVPFDPDSRLLSLGSESDDPALADLRACYAENVTRFLDFLELEGERSPDLTPQVAG